MSAIPCQPNWFNTLNEALEAEGLLTYWPFGVNVSYGQTVAFNSHGLHISIYRDERGMYERPIHYATTGEDTYR